MRRFLPIVLGTLIVLAGIGGLLLVFQSRDGGSIDGPQGDPGPGVLEVDLGREHAPDTRKLSKSPPTTGPHPEELPAREGAWTDGEIIAALELGNVVLVHASNPPPAKLVALQKELSGGYDSRLAESGQAVILVRRPEAEDIQALAWRRRLRAQEPTDPNLRDFAEKWLGVGPPDDG